MLYEFGFQMAQSSTNPEALKLLFVGTAQSGKTALLITYTTGEYPSQYIPTIFDNYSMESDVYGRSYYVALWDSRGSLGDYDRLRPLSFPQTDAFLVCFDIANRNSFEQTRDKWIPDLNQHKGDSPRILVGCKSDLRSTHAESACVSVEEAKAMAVELKCYQYVEISSLRKEGLNELFSLAEKVAAVHYHNLKVPSYRKTAEGRHEPMEIVLPPDLPPSDPEPEIVVGGETIEEGGLELLQSGACADTVLVLANGEEMFAHRAVIASASGVFRNALGINPNKPASAYNHPAIVKVESCEGPHSTRIYLSEDVKPQVLKHALQFFYAGKVVIDGIPSTRFIKSLGEFGEMFSIHFLRQFAQNLANHDEDLNPSIGQYFMDFVSQKMKELLLEKDLYADVRFIFTEREVVAHKCILSARNRTMAAMFDGRFMEGNNEEMTTIDMRKDNQIESDAFLVMLEYLYTGHAPLDKGVDPVSILIVADRYNVTHLTNLCELLISKQIEQVCTTSIKNAGARVIQYLNVANLYNAQQLAKGCLYLLCTHYTKWCSLPEWSELSSKDVQYIEKHRWPPLEYRNQLEQYNKYLERNNLKHPGSTKFTKSSCLLM